MAAARASRSYAAMSAWATALAVLQVLTIGAGLARVGMSRLLAWVVIAASIAAGAATYRFLARGAAPWETLLSRGSRAYVAAAVLGVTALYACVLVSGWAKPELSFDGCTYHVPTIHFWAERGYVHWIAPDQDAGLMWRTYVDTLLNAYPKGGELVGFVLVRAFDGSQPANLLTLPFLPLGLLGIACIARALGARRELALAAGLSYLLVPTNLSQAVTTYVDAAYASSVIAWLAAMVVSFEAVMEGESLARTLPASASALGLALATKPSSLAPVGVGVALLAAASLVQGRRDLRAASRRACVAALAPLAIGLLVGGYWYARNWMHTGNPIFPVRVSVLGHEIFRGVPLADAIAEKDNTPAHLLGMPNALRVLSTWSQGAFARLWPDSVRFYDAREGGLGFLWLLGGVPSSAILAARAWRDRAWPARLAFAALALTVAVCFFATPMRWWARYTLWIHGVGLPALAVVAGDALARPRWPRLAGGAWLALAGALVARESFVAFRWATLGSCFIGEPPPITSPSDLWRALTEYDDGWAFYHELRGHPLALEALSGGGTIAIGSATVPEVGIVGVAGAPNGRPRVVLLDDNMLADGSNLSAVLARDHVSWVFYGAHRPPSAALARIARRQENVDPLWIVYDVR